MAITELLGSLGSWDLQLAEATPDDKIAQLGFFGHLAICDGVVDVEAVGDGLLTGARYVGVLRKKDRDTGRKLSGSGMVFWLGDEDGKGDVIETEISLTSATLSDAVTAIVGPSNAVTVGTVHAAAGTYTGKHQFQTRREALSIICDAFNVEFRVNGNATVDVGTAAQLYNTEAPDTIIKRKGAGADMDLVALGGDYEVAEAAYDYSTRVVLLGQTIGTGDTPDEVFATGSANAPSVPYLNLRGNAVKMSRTISESGTTSGSVAARAQLQLNRFNRVARSLKVTAEEFETEGNFVVGDNVYVYDPDTGIVNPAIEVTFRGEVLHPDIVRASGITWPVVRGMTVAFRTQAGVWIDLTPFVTYETGGNELTVGDLPKSLTRPGDNPVQVRLDAARADASVPNPPTGLTLTTSSTLNAQGVTGAVIHASWTAPTLNTDGSVLQDLSHYVVEYRWTARAPQWQQANATDLTEVDLIVVPGLPYEVRVTAYDLAGHPSAPTATEPITSAADAIAPNPPADPVVTSYLGQLRIEYTGVDSTGNPMASDTNRIDVHVSATSGFTPATTTRVDSINPFAKGVSYATAPYGSTRYVKLIAVDHSGNPSAASGQVSGATTQVADGDVVSMSVGKLTAGIMSADVTISGRFTTALTGQRAGIDSLGVFGYDASEALTIRLDGVNNLLTGRFQTALSGRRIEAGSSGFIGSVRFWAPDGRWAEIGGFSGAGGAEVLRLGVTTAGVSQFWNKIQLQDDGALFSWTAFHKIVVGGGGPEVAKKFELAWATGRGSSTNNTIPDYYRFQVDEQYNRFNHMSDTGGSIFYDRAANGSMALRFWIHGGGVDARIRVEGEGGAPAQYFAVHERNINDVVFPRFKITNDLVWFEWTRQYGNARIVFDPPNFTGFAPSIQLINHYNYGIILKAGSNSDGSNGRIEIRDAADTIFMPTWASAFVVNSDEASKTDIKSYAGDPLADIRALRLTTYKMKAKSETRKTTHRHKVREDEDEQVTEYEVRTAADPRTYLGVIAQEVSDLYARQTDKGRGVDVGSVVFGLVGAVQMLADLIDPEGKKAA